MNRRTSWQIQRAVLSALMLREIKARFGKHRLGIIMVLIEPMIHMVAIIVMFGYIRGQGGGIPDFPVFLLVGLVPFLLFKNITLRTMEGVSSEQSLLVYRQVHPLDIFMARIIIQVVISVSAYAIMLVILGWLGFNIQPSDPLVLLLLLGVVVPLGFGLGLVLNVVQETFPEAKIFVKVSFMPLYIASGILHPLYVLPPQFAEWLLWNPLLRVVELSRYSYFSNYPMPYPVGSSYIVVLSFFSLLLGVRAYRVRAQGLARA